MMELVLFVQIFISQMSGEAEQIHCTSLSSFLLFMPPTNKQTAHGVVQELGARPILALSLSGDLSKTISF